MAEGIYDAVKAASLPILVLAYLGDAVYELRIRRHLLGQGICKVNELHRAAVDLVRAKRQARLYHQIESLLEPTDADILRRGRNAKSGHQPPHVAVQEYRLATGLEALIGYLYLSEQEEKLDQIFAILLESG